MPYRTQSIDTSEEVERVQIEHLRRIGARERARRASRLTARNWAGMKRAFHRLHPGWTPQQLRIEWVRVQYGDELAGRYAQWLAQRSVDVA